MRKRNLIVPALTLLVGIGIGTSGEAEPTIERVEVPVEKVVTKTVEKKVEVPVVPEACIKALADADALTVTMSDVSTLVSDHLGMDQRIWTGLSEGDLSALVTGPAELTHFNEGIAEKVSEVEGNTYAQNRDACRAS